MLVETEANIVSRSPLTGPINKYCPLPATQAAIQQRTLREKGLAPGEEGCGRQPKFATVNNALDHSLCRLRRPAFGHGFKLDTETSVRKQRAPTSALQLCSTSANLISCMFPFASVPRRAGCGLHRKSVGLPNLASAHWAVFVDEMALASDLRMEQR